MTAATDNDRAVVTVGSGVGNRDAAADTATAGKRRHPDAATVAAYN